MSTHSFAAELDSPGRRPGESATNAVSVETINQVLKDVVEGAFMPLWISGEVSDFKRHRNGHWYFTLRDKNAQLRCVVWSREQRRIPAMPDDGMQVAAFGQLTVYAARGDVQFSVRGMEAEGDGLWRKALEQTRLRLEGDGLLSPDRKRSLPRFPRRIAVITSPDGAALHDVIHVSRRRCPWVDIVVVPARVQGEGAPAELRDAVDRVSRWGGADVVIIGRGGGAREDLWSFNDEALARAIAACPVPTISAVGHEVDTTICDLVADYRAATPSAAAEAAVPAVADLAGRVRATAARIRMSLQHSMLARAERLRLLKRALPSSYTRHVEHGQSRLRVLAARINDLSPLSTLARGYGIAEGEGGETLSRVGQFHVGTQFVLHVRDGSVAAITREITPNHEGKKDVV